MKVEYLAGFIDADGCVVIGNGTINIRACNKNVPLLLEMQKVFGGKLANASGETGVYNLRWYGDEALKLADLIEDHLILKKEELLIMREYAETRGARGRHTSYEIKQRRKELEGLIKQVRANRMKKFEGDLATVDGVFVKES